jgi:hypothetical protein
VSLTIAALSCSPDRFLSWISELLGILVIGPLLPPLTIDSLFDKFNSSSIAGNGEGQVSELLVSDGPGLLIEIEQLRFSSILSLENHLWKIGSWQVNVSVLSVSRLDVEWFFNNESEFWAQFSLYWLLWHLINVDQVPELVNLASS